MEPKKNPAKDVHRYSKHFFLIGLSISSLLLIMAFEWQSTVNYGPDCSFKVEVKDYAYLDETILLPDQSQMTPKEKKVLVNLESIVETTEFIPEANSPEIIIEDVGTGAPEFTIIDIPVEPTSDTFIIVEKMPLPVGGYASFYKQVAKSTNYPIQAVRSQNEGKVFIEFVINQSGEVVNLKVIKGIGFGCDEEALRVLRQTKWEPGKQRGIPVAVKMVLPITFRLN